MQRAFALALLVTMIVPSLALAAIIDTDSCWDAHSTINWGQIAQSFVMPAGNTRLVNYTFHLDPLLDITSVSFTVFAWDPAAGPTGPALVQRTLAWPEEGGAMLVEDLNLPLEQGTTYAAIVDLGVEVYTSHSVHFMLNQDCYAQGNAAWWDGEWQYLDSEYSTRFRAEFDDLVGNEDVSWGSVKAIYRP